MPAEMTSKEIKTEVAQNLEEVDSDLKDLTYIYRLKNNRRVTNCVLEISPVVRKNLMKNDRIYLRYAACKFANHTTVF